MGGGASKVAPKDSIAADYEQLKRDYAALKKAHDETLAFHHESGPRYASDDKVVREASPKRQMPKMLKKQSSTTVIRGASKMKLVAKEAQQRQSSIRQQVESLQADLPHVRKVFDELAHKAEPTDEIGFKEFGEVLNKRLHLDLGDHELKRIWDALFADDNSKGAQKTAPEERAQ